MLWTVAVVAVVVVAIWLLARFLRAGVTDQKREIDSRRADKTAQAELMKQALGTRPANPEEQ
jgi:uncharacterized sodium:solute symporter family permease YidK